MAVKSLRLGKDDMVTIEFPYHPSIVSGVKKIPTRKFDPVFKHWTVELSEETASPLMAFCKEFNFTIPSELAEIALPMAVEYEVDHEIKLHSLREGLEASKAFDAQIEVQGLNGELRDYQKAGVAYVVKHKKVILADDMGLGKTIQAIAAIHHLDAYPALITCPASVKYNWKKQFNTWLPDIYVSVFDLQTKEWDPTADVIIVNDEKALSKFYPILKEINFAALVLDESHRFKNKKTQRTTTINQLRAGIPIRMLLTGTSITNRPIELVPQLEILDKLDKFGGYWKFAKRYCGAERTRFGIVANGADNLEELHTKLRSMCYIRREKKDVAKELPDKQREIIEVEISNRKEYFEAEADIVKYAGKKAAQSAALNDKLDEEDFDEMIENAKDKANAAQVLVQITALKRIAAEGKIAEAKAWISDFIENDQKLLVFANNRKLINELVKHFNCPFIDGRTPSKMRQQIVEDFVTSEHKVMILNMKSAGTGVDGLQGSASNMLFLELGWNPAIHDQSEDRLYRIGQTENVTCYYMLGMGTIDMDIFELIEEKRKVTNAVNKGDHYEGSSNMLEELLDRIAGKMK